MSTQWYHIRYTSVQKLTQIVQTEHLFWSDEACIQDHRTVESAVEISTPKSVMLNAVYTGIYKIIAATVRQDLRFSAVCKHD